MFNYIYSLCLFPWIALLWGVHPAWFWGSIKCYRYFPFWPVCSQRQFLLGFHWNRTILGVYWLIVLAVVYFSMREFMFFTLVCGRYLYIKCSIWMLLRFIVCLFIFAYITPFCLHFSMWSLKFLCDWVFPLCSRTILFGLGSFFCCFSMVSFLVFDYFTWALF